MKYPNREIEEGIMERQIDWEMRFIDDEQRLDVSRRATELERGDMVEMYLKENFLGCEGCQDCLRESCKLFKTEHFMDISQCEKIGLKIEGYFDDDYNFKFKMMKVSN